MDEDQIVYFNQKVILGTPESLTTILIFRAKYDTYKLT